MRIIMLTRETDAAAALPASSFLDSPVQCLPPAPSSYVAAEDADVVLVDARHDLSRARALCQLLAGPLQCPPILLVLDEGGAAAVQPDWGAADLIMSGAGPAELAARLRLLRPTVTAPPSAPSAAHLEVGELVIDVNAYTVRLRGQVIDLTYKEFELLKYMVQHQGHVLTRETLLDEVWGENYIGGARTVDVHVRRLRAKLEMEHNLIGTVRNVGYRLDAPGA